MVFQQVMQVRRSHRFDIRVEILSTETLPRSGFQKLATGTSAFPSLSKNSILERPEEGD
jgi:hypothetical protein